MVAQRIAEDLRGAAGGAARPRARLPGARAQHADALAGRAAAPAARHAGALQPVRRRLRARRAVGRPASGRHRGAAARARPAEGVGQLAVRRRARARRDPPRRLDRRRRARRPASTAAQVLYSGPPDGLAAGRGVADARATCSATRRVRRAARRAQPTGWLRLAGVTRNNLHGLDVAFPLGVFTTRHRRVGLGQVEPGQPGAGRAGRRSTSATTLAPTRTRGDALERAAPRADAAAASPAGMERIKRLVRVDQKPIGRTPRSNLATYTGLFDHVRKLFAATQGGAGAPLRRRALLVQRRQGPLRDTARARAS